jgi:hypothetical protein
MCKMTRDLGRHTTQRGKLHQTRRNGGLVSIRGLLATMWSFENWRK